MSNQTVGIGIGIGITIITSLTLLYVSLVTDKDPKTSTEIINDINRSGLTFRIDPDKYQGGKSKYVRRYIHNKSKKKHKQ